MEVTAAAKDVLIVAFTLVRAACFYKPGRRSRAFAMCGNALDLARFGSFIRVDHRQQLAYAYGRQITESEPEAIQTETGQSEQRRGAEEEHRGCREARAEAKEVSGTDSRQGG